MSGDRPEQSSLRRRSGGMSFIELMVAVAVLMVLASAVIPVARWDAKRLREDRLRTNLKMMRSAIDLYHKYVEEGMIIQEDVEQVGYPLTLEELVEGVEVGDPQSPESTTMRFLQRLPIDPFTGDSEWGLRSYQDDWDSQSWGGENVYDVYSLSDMRALDDSYYNEW